MKLDRSRQSHMAVLCLTFILSWSCKDAEELSEKVSIKLDPSLSQHEKELLRENVRFIASRELGNESSRWFSQVFGGKNGIDTLKFMDDRVGAVISEQVKIAHRLRLAEVDLGRQTHATTVAVNVGTSLFMSGASSGLNLKFKLGRSRLPVNDPRVGIIQLGPGFQSIRSNVVAQTGTLMHEARHSDCTGGLSAGDLNRLNKGLLPKRSSCGHLHELCPQGHPLENEYACDGHAWGAYAVGAVYSNELARNCRNCSFDEQMAALASAAESWSRVKDAKALIEGLRGNPDMSSSTLINRSRLKSMLAEFHRTRKDDGKEITDAYVE